MKIKNKQIKKFIFRIDKKLQKRQKIVIIIANTFQVLAICILLYLIALPIYPVLKYKLLYENNNVNTENYISTDKYIDDENINSKEKDINIEAEGANSHLLQSEYSVSPNRLIIKKIGVNAPIVESKNSEYGLSKGAWRVPESSTPSQGSNTVITGHRFKYLPPSNLTFYLFHKLVEGDMVHVIWDKDDYYYRIREIKVVDKTEVSILEAADEPILTLFTCDPIYSQENRLVVIGELIKNPF